MRFNVAKIELRRKLTLVFLMIRQSLRRELSRQSSAHRSKSGQKDAEKEGEDDDDFDLLSYLRGQQSKADDAGMYRKVVGVSWTDLTVVGAGGMKVSVVFSSRCFRNSSVSLTTSHSDLDSYLSRRCERGCSLASDQILENHQVRSFQGFSSKSSRIFRRLPQARRALPRSWPTWIWMYYVPQDYRQSTRRLPRCQRRCRLRRNLSSRDAETVPRRSRLQPGG